VKNVKVTPLFLSLVAGMGHLWEGRDLKGLVLFASFAAGSAGILEGTLLWSGPGKAEILAISLLATVAVWVYSFVDILRLTYEPWREKNRLRRNEHLRQGILSFLRCDYETAEREFLANIRLEPGDPESLFRLAVICRIRGELSRARRYLRALRRTDVDEKWNWERSQEEALIVELERELRKRVAPDRVPGPSPASLPEQLPSAGALQPPTRPPLPEASPDGDHEKESESATSSSG
jgi:hypothetical protein